MQLANTNDAEKGTIGNMTVQQNGETFLSTTEAMERLGISSPITFRAIREKYGIKSYTVLGQGRTQFFKEKDIDNIPRVQLAEEE